MGLSPGKRQRGLLERGLSARGAVCQGTGVERDVNLCRRIRSQRVHAASVVARLRHRHHLRHLRI